MKSVELAMKAGRARQSPLTGFVHLSHENPERGSETIPCYENFCFALALFRTKTAESILEGKALLEKLFAFQAPVGFPIYLHEFPECKSRRVQYNISIVAQFLLRDFSSVLGEVLRSKLTSLVIPIEKTVDGADFLIQSQLTGDDPMPALKWWDGKALCFIGPQKQNKAEPEVTLFDLIMGDWTGKMSARALIDNPVHILASLIYPNKVEPTEVKQVWIRRFWGDGKPTHSALLQAQGSIVESDDAILIDLPEKEVHDEMEISYYIDRHPGVNFSVGGLKSTTFQLDEPVRVESGDQIFEVTFSLLEGDGRFWGHLHLGNRPGQMGCKGVDKHQAFDWRIALRTIERTKPCRIKLQFRAIN